MRSRYIRIILLICILLLTVQIQLFAETQIHSKDLLMYWTQNGYPDTVSSVCIEDNHTIVLLTENSEENQNEIKNLVLDSENIFFQTGKYSYNYMKCVEEEIIENYLKKDKDIYSVGISSYSPSDKTHGFGSNHLESRVCITMSNEAYNLYHSELEQKYGDVIQLFKGESIVFFTPKTQTAKIALKAVIFFLIIFVLLFFIIKRIMRRYKYEKNL